MSFLQVQTVDLHVCLELTGLGGDASETKLHLTGTYEEVAAITSVTFLVKSSVHEQTRAWMPAQILEPSDSVVCFSASFLGVYSTRSACATGGTCMESNSKRPACRSTAGLYSLPLSITTSDVLHRVRQG